MTDRTETGPTDPRNLEAGALAAAESGRLSLAEQKAGGQYQQKAFSLGIKTLPDGWMVADGQTWLVPNRQGGFNKTTIPSHTAEKAISVRLEHLGRYTVNGETVTAINADGTVCVNKATPEHMLELEDAGFKPDTGLFGFPEGSEPADPEFKKQYLEMREKAPPLSEIDSLLAKLKDENADDEPVAARAAGVSEAKIIKKEDGGVYFQVPVEGTRETRDLEVIVIDDGYGFIVRRAGPRWVLANKEVQDEVEDEVKDGDALLISKEDNWQLRTADEDARKTGDFTVAKSLALELAEKYANKYEQDWDSDSEEEIKPEEGPVVPPDKPAAAEQPISVSPIQFGSFEDEPEKPIAAAGEVPVGNKDDVLSQEEIDVLLAKLGAEYAPASFELEKAQIVLDAMLPLVFAQSLPEYSEIATAELASNPETAGLSFQFDIERNRLMGNVGVKGSEQSGIRFDYADIIADVVHRGSIDPEDARSELGLAMLYNTLVSYLQKEGSSLKGGGRLDEISVVLNSLHTIFGDKGKLAEIRETNIAQIDKLIVRARGGLTIEDADKRMDADVAKAVSGMDYLSLLLGVKPVGVVEKVENLLDFSPEGGGGSA